MGIREIVLLACITPIPVIALVYPRAGLYGYIWYALMRPDLIAFAENKYPISLTLAIATALGSWPYIRRVGLLFRNPFSLGVLVLQIPVGVSVLTAVRPELAADRYGFYIRMILVLLLIPVLIETEIDLRNLMLVMALSLGFVGLKFGIYGVIHGGVELASGYGEMLGDNNFVALALAMLVPLSWYCRLLVSSKVLRPTLVAIIAASIAGVIMSNSRGGILSLALGLLLVIVQARRKVFAFVCLAAVLGGSVYLVQDMFVKRMSTLRNYREEASAESRLEHAETALTMWKDYPLQGVGFGGLNYAFLASRYTGKVNSHVAHNSYLQMLVDSGIFAFAIYSGVLVYAIMWLARAASRAQGTVSELQYAAQAIWVPLAVFAFGSTFYSCQRMDLPYLFLMCAASLYLLERQGAFESQENRDLDDG